MRPEELSSAARTHGSRVAPKCVQQKSAEGALQGDQEETEPELAEEKVIDNGQLPGPVPPGQAL